MAERDRGGGAGDARHRMMLGHPEAVVAEPLAMLREFPRIAERLAGIPAFDDRGEIENGKRYHAPDMGTARR